MIQETVPHCHLHLQGLGSSGFLAWQYWLRLGRDGRQPETSQELWFIGNDDVKRRNIQEEKRSTITLNIAWPLVDKNALLSAIINSFWHLPCVSLLLRELLSVSHRKSAANVLKKSSNNWLTLTELDIELLDTCPQSEKSFLQFQGKHTLLFVVSRFTQIQRQVRQVYTIIQSILSLRQRLN